MSKKTFHARNQVLVPEPSRVSRMDLAEDPGVLLDVAASDSDDGSSGRVPLTDGRRFFRDTATSDNDGSAGLQVVCQPGFAIAMAAESSPSSSDEPLEFPPMLPPEDAPALEIKEGNCSDKELVVDADLKAFDASSWKPGLNCGTFVGRVGGQSLSAQSQVLICNVLTNIDLLTKSMAKACLHAIRPEWTMASSKQSFSARLSGYLLGLPAITVRKIWSAVKASGWNPELWLQITFFLQFSKA